MVSVPFFPAAVSRSLRTIFTDIDDTLTTDGKLPASAYGALWRARDAGIDLVPVTGRPAGWCDHIARMWPVAAVVGENGALAYALRPDGGDSLPRMQRLYSADPADAQRRLRAVGEEIIRQFPLSRIAADQPYRLFDLAIDVAEEVQPLPDSVVDQIVAIFQARGATAKISSIHVNGWFGSYDKLSMCRRCSEEFFGRALDPERDLFVGDSPNDEPMFAFFKHAVGVANVKRFAARIRNLPQYVTTHDGGEGFAELIDIILGQRSSASR